MDSVGLALAIERATWELQRVCAARGYPRIRLEGAPGRPLHLIAESDGGVRVEGYFPPGMHIDLIVAWAGALPFPPTVEVFGILEAPLIEGAVSEAVGEFIDETHAAGV